MDKELLLFPLMSGAARLLSEASFAAARGATGYGEKLLAEGAAPAHFDNELFREAFGG